MSTPTSSSPYDIIVRASREEDIAAITEIYREAVLNGIATFEEEPPGQDEMVARRARLLEAGYPYLVADLNGHLVGYAYAGPYRLRVAYRHTVENSVYVARTAQRRGIGRCLMEALIVAAEESGFRQMVAVISELDRPGSLALHAALGFEHIGTFKGVGFKHGRWLDTVMMQRALGSGIDAPPEMER